MTGPPRPDSADFFDEAYYRLLAPFHPEEEARHQVAALREILGLAQDDRVLDVGCGWGRHLSLLREAGHDVVGVDLSYALLRRAGRDSLEAEGLVVGDMVRMPLHDEAFDAAINLATSLGLFLDDATAVLALREIRRVLRPGGLLLLDEIDGDEAAASFADRDSWVLEDGTEVRVRRRLDTARCVSHEVLAWHGPGGAGKKRHSLRLRGASEVTGLVESSGLGVEGVYGGWDLEPPGPPADRVIVVARVPR